MSIHLSVLFGPFWTNVLSYWTKRHLPHLLIIAYEEMKRDLPAVIRKVARFLGKEISDEQVEILKGHLDFDSMKDNRAIYWSDEEDKSEEQKRTEAAHGKFFRKGAVGTYKEEMSEEIVEEIDRWTEEAVGDVPELLEMFRRFVK